jgi:glycosyltransferase involved in cell wall biosynthesis
LFLTSLQAGIAAREANLPFVVTVHGVMARRGLLADSLQEAYLRTLGALVFKLATRVVCVSKADVGEITRMGCLREKIRVVPNAVDTRSFTPEKGRRRRGEILWVGRFVPEKGLRYLLSAFRKVLEKRDATLRLVGDGPEAGRIKQLASDLDMKDKVLFEGRVGKEEVARFMAEASIFVLPSIKEGLPKVLLQAMASELPVAASRIPGVSGIIAEGQTGLLFVPRDPQDILRAMLSLLDDERLARSIGRKGRELVMRDFSWESTLAKLDTVYDEAISIPRRSD